MWSRKSISLWNSIQTYFIFLINYVLLKIYSLISIKKMIFRFKSIFKREMSTLADDIAVKKLIEYLKIKTVHPEPDYGIIRCF